MDYKKLIEKLRFPTWYDLEEPDSTLLADAADVAPVVHGHWEGLYQEGACSWSGRCSVCRKRNDIPHPFIAHYCPGCGAKMDGERSTK